MNLQIYSTLQGMRKARELGVAYLLKTRSDMRLYQIGSIDFLKNVLEENPVFDSRMGLQKRIVTGDFRCLGIQFYVLRRNQDTEAQNMNARIYSFLKETGLEGRLLEGDRMPKQERIDYGLVEKILAKRKEQSLQFLKNVLEEASIADKSR